MVGSGPYQVTERAQNNRVVLKAARSWRAAPEIDNVIVRHIPDDATRGAAFAPARLATLILVLWG